MSSHRAERPRRGRRLGRGPLVVLSVAAALASVTSIGTYAFWKDTATVTGATITSGTLDVKVNGGGADVDNIPTWTPLQLTNMAPGESIASVLTLKNAGNVPLTLSLTASAAAADTNGNQLVDAARVKIFRGPSTSASAEDLIYPRVQTCSGGTQVFGGTTGGQLGAVATTVLTGLAVAPAGSTTFCIEVALPSTVTDVAVQGKTYRPSLAFVADQAQ